MQKEGKEDFIYLDSLFLLPPSKKTAAEHLEDTKNCDILRTVFRLNLQSVWDQHRNKQVGSIWHQFAQMIRKWYQWGQMSALHQKSKQPRWKCLVVAWWGSGGTLALIYNGCMWTPLKMIMCLHYHSWPFASFLFFQMFLSGAFWGETGKENDKNNKGENHTSFWSKSQKKNAQTRQFHQLSSNYLTETIQILLWHVQRCKKKNITKNGKIAQDPRWRFSSKKIN